MITQDLDQLLDIGDIGSKRKYNGYIYQYYRDRSYTVDEINRIKQILYAFYWIITKPLDTDKYDFTFLNQFMYNKHELIYKSVEGVGLPNDLSNTFKSGFKNGLYDRN